MTDSTKATEGPLLRLVDGDVLTFSEDNWSEGGCDTCDWGSSYVQNFTVQTTQGDWRFDFDVMYEYAISHEFLLNTILPNTEAIESMTIAQFVEWLVSAFKESSRDHYFDHFTFEHYKVGEK